MRIVALSQIAVAVSLTLSGFNANGQTAVATPTISTSMQSVFDLAAELYPTMFKNGTALGLYEGYVYKYFADSGIYVGIKDDKVYTLGGIYGNAVKEQGPVSAVLGVLQTAKANIAATTTGNSGSTSGATTTGIVFTANGITRSYQVGNSPVSTSSTGFKISYASEASSSALAAAIYIPNKIGIYACGSGVGAATNNGFFSTAQTAWIEFTGSAFGGTPLDNFGGSCSVEVSALSPKLEGKFTAQLFGAAAGNGRVTEGTFSAPNQLTVSTATAGTGTGSLVITARNTTVPANRVGTMSVTGFGLSKTNNECSWSGRGTYPGSSEIYTITINRTVGSGQLTGWTFQNADASFTAGGGNIGAKAIDITKNTKTVRIDDNFGTTGNSNSIKIVGSIVWTDVGDVTGC